MTARNRGAPTDDLAASIDGDCLAGGTPRKCPQVRDGSVLPKECMTARTKTAASHDLTPSIDSACHAISVAGECTEVRDGPVPPEDGTVPARCGGALPDDLSASVEGACPARGAPKE